ncbi:MAG: response regulator [Firmicutes bacterium]|nr:response regulator [Bacillota bacterium]
MEGERVLIVDSETRIVELAVIKLSNAGYWVVTAYNGQEALEKIANNPPELLVINYKLPQIDGYQVCLEVRNKLGLLNLPIILMVDSQFDEDEFRKYEIKINDILVKPFTPKTLLGRVNAQIIRTKVLKEINPLTELPGKTQLQEELTYRIKDGKHFNLIFCDIRGFMTFNKVYGLERGNEVIRHLARLIREEAGKLGALNLETYHLGGDDFAILTEPGRTEELCRIIAERFDREIKSFYNEEDQARGGMVVPNRRGIIEQWPVMTLAMGIVSNEERVINDWLEAELIGLEVLKCAQSLPGSGYFKDRRRS